MIDEMQKMEMAFYINHFDGFTFNPTLGEFHEGGGYAVAASRGDWLEFDLNQITVEKAVSEAWARFLEAFTEDLEYCFGAWVDGDRLVFDPSVILSNYEDAVKMACLLQQDAIWDMGRMCEIRLSEVSL